MNQTQYAYLTQKRESAWQAYQAANRRYCNSGTRADMRLAETAYQRYLGAQSAVILAPDPEDSGHE